MAARCALPACFPPCEDGSLNSGHRDVLLTPCVRSQYVLEWLMQTANSSQGEIILLDTWLALLATLDLLGLLTRLTGSGAVCDPRAVAELCRGLWIAGPAAAKPSSHEDPAAAVTELRGPHASELCHHNDPAAITSDELMPSNIESRGGGPSGASGSAPASASVSSS